MQTTQIFLRSTDKNIKVRGVLLAYIPNAEFVRHFCSLCQDIRSEYTYMYTLVRKSYTLRVSWQRNPDPELIK